MAERSLLLTKENRALVRAVPILKTHTRRVIVPQPHEVLLKGVGGEMTPYRWVPESDESSMYGDYDEIKPRYQVGDELWMLEPYQVYAKINSGINMRTIQGEYSDDGSPFHVQNITESEWEKFNARKKPYARTSSRFMYKSLARTWVKVTRVWVEQTQDISWQDCKAEGMTLVGDELIFNNQEQQQSLLKTKFQRLWDSINKKRGYGWDVNPWVFCYEFERIEK